MAYRCFTRTWWRDNSEWPNGLEPHAGTETDHEGAETEEEARALCREWNNTHEPGRLSRKMEYEEV